MAEDGLFRLDGMVAMVTGGGQGIGAAVCRRFAAAGAKVAVFDMNPEPAGALAKELGGIACVGSVTSEADLERVRGEIEAKLGPLSVVVNNAGITGRSTELWDLSKKEWDQVFDVNVTGVFLVCKIAMPGMLERGFGRVINIASVAGKEGNPRMSPYSASKAAVIGLTKSLAKEVAGKGDITVNSISPAVIHTPILDGLPQSTVDYMVSRIPIGRTGKPEEVASLIHFLASREASFTTGQCYDISGGRCTY